MCGSCAGSTSSCPLRHPALHYVCMQSCGELTPTTSHCAALCVEGCGELTPTVSHCTALCGSLCGICRAVGQLSARSYSGCTRFLLVVFFFCSPLPVLLEIYGSEGLCGEGQESDGVFVGREAWMSTNW